MGKACEKRAMQYAIITDSPFLYGVGYALTPNRQTPIKLELANLAQRSLRKLLIFAEITYANMPHWHYVGN